jgi:GNAT superfamily N-acetyltransferase
VNTLTPGWETDLAILRLSGSIITAFPDHLVIRSPHNPEFHWGNFILVTNKDAVDDASRWFDVFQQAFPNVKWVSIGLPLHPEASDAWDVLGLELERMEVMKASSMPKMAELDGDYNSRQLQGQDWELLLERELSENLKSGEHDPESFERFMRKTIETEQRLCEIGKAAWFGAFDGDELVADLGIVVCGETARYQSVQTDERHRRKGLASHLLGMAANWAAEQGCTSWVIVTESSNDAGRVYKKAGFLPDQEPDSYLIKTL